LRKKNREQLIELAGEYPSKKAAADWKHGLKQIRKQLQSATRS